MTADLVVEASGGGQEPVGLHVDGEDLVILLGGDVQSVGARKSDTSGGNGVVEAAELLNGLGQHGVDALLAGAVAEHADNATGRGLGLQLLGGVEAELLGNAADHDVAAGGDESLSGCLTDARATTHNDSGLASHNLIRRSRKPICHVKLPFLV